MHSALFFTPTLAAVSNTIIVLAIAFALVCLLMMLIILIQKPKGGGLSGAFGGSGGSESAFMGAKVGDFLTIATVSFFVLFVLLAMGLTWAISPRVAPLPGPVAQASTETPETPDSMGDTETATDADEVILDDAATTEPADTLPAPGSDAPADPAPTDG